MGPGGTFAGYFMIVFGVIGTYFNLTGLILAVAGMFTAFTYDGTIIDFNYRRIKGYISLFGFIRIGKWHTVNRFDKFRIYRSRRRSTMYSRAGVPLDMKSNDIRLVFMNNEGSLKVTINKYNSFTDARNEMTELIRDLQITRLEEWSSQACDKN